MSTRDQLQRFIFDGSDIRGEVITLNDSFQTVVSKGDYGPVVQQLLGEFMAAAGLLSATLKFDGILTLQARGDGPLGLIMADCTRQQNLRAIAELNDGISNDDIADKTDLRELIGHGHLVITIDPAKGERYQGIVPLDQPTLSGCLETYFKQSEQLPTRIWLCANETTAAGLMLQALPEQEASQEENSLKWEHLTQLADTLKPEEQLTLSANDQLYRLFHQDEVRLFEATEMQFFCSCSRQRTEQMIRSIAREELNDILEERGTIEVHCHFCNELYRFNRADIDKLFGEQPPTLH